MTQEESMKLDILAGGYMGSPLTDEQKEFASNFTRDIISFSDPGTGKTHTLVVGLLMAQAYHKVPGKLINCMSFTNAAVSEMSGRYQKYCKKCSIPPTVKFNTFHSLSNQIMKEAYPAMSITSHGNIKQDVEDLIYYMRQEGLEVDETDKSYVRKVLRAINNLNSSLTFHPDNVATKYEFVALDMDIDIFQSLRRSWFLRGITSNQIVQGDIPLYCLYALMKKEHIIPKWKGKYKIMVVDEFQDLSLLHLRILSYIAETLIVIGDMKQQIYAFNGACPRIVQEYMKLHPNAVVCNLTKSWRCGQEIADFATRLIMPNDRSIKVFTGHDRGSSVQMIHRRDMKWDEIASNIEADIKKHGRANARDVMFLYRNNASAVPLIEQLYKKGIPYRCSKFVKVMDMPMFDSLSALANAAWQPSNYVFVDAALRLFPEFKETPLHGQIPVISAMQASGKDLFNVSYKFKESSSYDIITAMKAANNAIMASKSAGVVYMKLLEVYKKHIFKNEWWKLDNTEDFYFGLAAHVCNFKPYPLMYSEELDKENKNMDAIRANMGIRCYTMHTAKGLEADDVYILDCDEGMFPNAKVMKNKLTAGCEYDVATDIRSERNLLYVAVTRAKENVIISYSGAEPTKLITNPESADYCQYDAVYDNTNNDYDDAAEFFKLFNIGEVK